MEAEASCCNPPSYAVINMDRRMLTAWIARHQEGDFPNAPPGMTCSRQDRRLLSFRLPKRTEGLHDFNNLLVRTCFTMSFAHGTQ
jgi:hypothetical protein